MRDTSYKVHTFTRGNFPYFGLWVSELRIAEEGRRDKERQKLQSTYLSHKVSSFPELISQISIFGLLVSELTLAKEGGGG